jgi:hypothetical protein
MGLDSGEFGNDFFIILDRLEVGDSELERILGRIEVVKPGVGIR